MAPGTRANPRIEEPLGGGSAQDGSEVMNQETASTVIMSIWRLLPMRPLNAVCLRQLYNIRSLKVALT